MEQTKIDILIVGAGPMGIATGIEAQKNNLSHLILEKGALVNSIYHFPKNMTFFSTSEKLEIGKVPFMSIHDKPTRDEALEYYRRVVEFWDLNLNYYEEVINIEKQEDGAYLVTSKKGTYLTQYVVIATGFYGNPNMLRIPGEDLDKVSHYYDNAHRFINQEVAVIGAGNSATQVALELHYKGAHVTMIVRDAAIGENVKYWIKPNIENRIKEGSIQAYFNAELTQIDEDTVTFTQDNEEITIDNDYVLALTGYQPDYEFLSQIGVVCDTSEKKIPDFKPESHQTNQEGIYIAGVVCGGLQTNTYSIENSMEHAKKIIQNILRQNS
ncbi:YpdA family putative bacillithiol disulfide reductase [Flavobacteriaceae bacterium Ap0902]|nr:YpdA family putative bacillithiol disulfide reductase [Flavobacteriaceae bacterium Ap0902]